MKLEFDDPTVEIAFQRECISIAKRQVRYATAVAIAALVVYAPWDSTIFGYRAPIASSIRVLAIAIAACLYWFSERHGIDGPSRRYWLGVGCLALFCSAAVSGITAVLGLANPGIGIASASGALSFALGQIIATAGIGLTAPYASALLLFSSVTHITLVYLFGYMAPLAFFGHAFNVGCVSVALALIAYVRERMLRENYQLAHSLARETKKARRRISVFLCYRREDSLDVCGRIYDVLIDEFGENAVTRDIDVVPLGIDYRDFLGAKIQTVDVVLAIIGTHWITSSTKGESRILDTHDPIRLELEAAFASQRRVVPVLVRSAGMPSSDQLPASLEKLAYVNAAQVRSDPDFRRDMARLVDRIIGVGPESD
jgi:hypothetical protein